MTKFLCLLLLPAACALAQTVEGSVFDAATGVGVSGVKVELLKGATPFYETATDGGGRFRFDNVREGEYAARYQSPDYWLTAGPSDYKTFPVTAASPVKLEVRLMPWSGISGRIVDSQGHGVANARLELTGSGMVANGRTYLRTSWGGGGGGQLSDHGLVMTFRGTADARGNFEVRLMPGAYGLSVLPPEDLKPPDPGPDAPALAWKRTYYPGVPNSDEALKIVVLPGGELTDVELKLLALPAHAVRGVVLHPDGTPAPKATIVLGEMPQFVSMESKVDGTFEFPSVAEGEWRFMAEVKSGTVKLRATAWIEVTRHDLEDVKLRLMVPLNVRGKVVVELPKDATPKDYPALRPVTFFLNLRGGHTRALSDLGMMGAVVVPDAQGEFTVQDAYPGVYTLASMLQPPAPPYYLESIRGGGTDLRLQDLEISSDLAITVLYKADGGSVRGTAENCASGGVLLFPSDPVLRRPGFSQAAPCDAAGHYEVRAVRPGDYYVLAFAGNGPAPALDEKLVNQAVKVTVRSGEVSVADVRAVTKPVY